MILACIIRNIMYVNSKCMCRKRYVIEGNRSNMSGWCIIWNIVICAKTSGFGIEYHK